MRTWDLLIELRKNGQTIKRYNLIRDCLVKPEINEVYHIRDGFEEEIVRVVEVVKSSEWDK